ncbi:MAG: alpha/beta hydrolase [Planctomycetota bacterium]
MKLAAGVFAISLALLLQTVAIVAQEPTTLPRGARAIRDIPYVPNGHERQKLDLFLPEGDSARPLAVFIHGGGFSGGDKRKLDPRDLRGLLEAGVAVASLNYRFYTDAPLPAAFEDCVRAVQFLRFRAAEWNLAPARFGVFGGSAGAQIAMYLAFHDDLADAASADAVARQSTRLTCVATSGGQVTLDLEWWIKHVPECDIKRTDPLTQFGVSTMEEAQQRIDAVAALRLVSRDDPPVFMTYGMAPGQPCPADKQTAVNWKFHHVVHGVELQKLADSLDVELHLKYPGAKARYGNAIEFLRAKLLADPEGWSDGPVRVDPQNPHYLNYRGKPIILVVSDHTWFAVTAADYDYARFFDALAANHNNFTRIYPGAHPVNYENQPLIFPWAKSADGRYDLDKWNPAYFERLHALMKYAMEKEVIVDICLFNGWGTDEKKTYQWRWQWCPLNDANNVQDGVGVKRDHQCTLDEPQLVAYQKAYVRKIVSELNRYDNLIYDVADEPDFFNAIDDQKVNLWIDVMMDEIIQAEAALPKRHLIAETFHRSLEDHGKKWGADPRTSWISVEYTTGLEAFASQYAHQKPYVLIETTTPILNPLGFWGAEYGVDSSRVHAWPFMVAGGAGVLEFNDDFDSQAPAGRERTAEILRQRGILRKFIESFDFTRMRRFTGFSGIDAMPKRERAGADRTPPADLNRAWGTAMAETGRQYALYVSHSYVSSATARVGSAGGGPGCYKVVPGNYREAVTIKDVPARSYFVEWVNPADGTIVESTNIRHAGGNLSLPTPLFTIDIALRMMSAESETQ